MTLETFGSVLGAAVASAGVVIVGAKRWLTKPAEKKLDAMSAEIGVGTVGPSLLSLVATTASAVARLEGLSEHNGTGITEILNIQKAHGEKLDKHEKRFEAIEGQHKVLNARFGNIACVKPGAKCAPLKGKR